MNKLVSALLSVVCPDLCLLCGTSLIEGEEKICLNCVLKLSVTNFLPPYTDNELTERLATLRADVRRGVAFMHYERGNHSARLIQEIKFNKRPSAMMPILDYHVPRLMSEGFFDGIDLLMPVPQHWTRLLSRGYSQTLILAREMSKKTGIPVARNLYAKRRHTSQTQFDAEARRNNVVDVFAVRNPAQLAGKHILLVEDVVTTGSTVYNAMTTLSAAEPSVVISVYTLSLTL